MLDIFRGLGNIGFAAFESGVSLNKPEDHRHAGSLALDALSAVTGGVARDLGAVLTMGLGAAGRAATGYKKPFGFEIDSSITRGGVSLSNMFIASTEEDKRLDLRQSIASKGLDFISGFTGGLLRDGLSGMSNIFGGGIDSSRTRGLGTLSTMLYALAKKIKIRIQFWLGHRKR